MGWQSVEHIVVLMQENLSFDRVFGWMRPDVDGVDGVPPGVAIPVDDPLFPPGTTLSPAGDAALVPPGAPHMPWDMAEQLFGRGAVHTMLNVARRARGLDDAGRRALVRSVLAFHRRDDLPVYRDLAAQYAVADRWFAPIASATWPNRYFMHMATSPVGGLPLPELGGDQVTIFDRLNDAGLSWRIYVDGPATILTSQSVLRAARAARRAARRAGVGREDASPVRDFDRVLCDVSQTAALSPALAERVPASEQEALPTYTFIEPRHWPARGRPANNDHHHTHMLDGQRLVGTIYNALRADPARWAKTLFVVTYDEHGGYWDHVRPPAAPHPKTGARGTAPREGALDWYGGRVPALLMSPWIRRGGYHAVCDHTSVLAFLERRFGLAPLTERDRQADDLTGAFGEQLRDTVARVALPEAPVLAATGDRERDFTGMALDLYEVLAEQQGADAGAEVASLDAATLAARGEARARAACTLAGVG